MQVLPPANGKKLWRVKRSVSAGNSGSQQSDSSRECLNNSLRIAAAAGKQFVMKRPPMKRPRTKSGQRKDFVFVDLSPVKSEGDDVSVSSVTTDESFSSSLSPRQESGSPFSIANDSFSSTSSIEDEQLQQSLAQYDMQANVFDDMAMFGLGLMNVNYSHQPHSSGSISLPQSAYDNTKTFDLSQLQPQPHQQYLPTDYNTADFTYNGQQLGSPFLPTPTTHRRTQSTPVIPRRKSAGGFQFKTYKGPNTVKKPSSRKMRRTMSQPISASAAVMPTSQLSELTTPKLQCTATPTTAAPGFDYFSQASNNGFDLGYEQLDLAYSPITDLSDSDSLSSLLDPINLDLFPSSEAEPKMTKEEFDFSSFIAI